MHTSPAHNYLYRSLVPDIRFKFIGQRHPINIFTTSGS